MTAAQRARWLALLASLALACGGPLQQRYEEELAETPAPAAHAVHGMRLAELMRGLERLRSERLPQAMDVETERESRAQLVSEVALAMADSAERIPEATEVATLDPDRRREFLERAEALRRGALALAQRAGRRPPVSLDADVAALEATCQGCHQRFRADAVGGLDADD